MIFCDVNLKTKFTYQQLHTKQLKPHQCTQGLFWTVMTITASWGCYQHWWYTYFVLFSNYSSFQQLSLFWPQQITNLKILFKSFYILSDYGQLELPKRTIKQHQSTANTD